MPQQILLQQFGDHVRRAFGHTPFHVGSSLEKKDGWRDVDVRLMLPDEEFAAIFPKCKPDHMQHDTKWVSVILAWSAFGKAITGLPIDFQIQQTSLANSEHSKPRSALYSVCESIDHYEHVERLVAARLDGGV